MRIFECSSYREFIQRRVAVMPKNGRGELKKIAEALGIHTSTLSLILGGARDFSLEQACQLADHFGLNPLEAEYLLTLVQYERAGTERLKRHLSDRMRALREQARELVHQVRVDQSLSNEDKSTFYSSWIYSAISLLCSIPKYHTADEIADYFGLSKHTINQAIEFLTTRGLVEEKDGRLEMGTKFTHLESGSPLVARHHTNWRLKAIERYETLSQAQELAFSAPMSLSVKDASRIREMAMSFATEARALIVDSKPEVLYCLNLDWIHVRPNR